MKTERQLSCQTGLRMPDTFPLHRRIMACLPLLNQRFRKLPQSRLDASKVLVLRI